MVVSAADGFEAVVTGDQSNFFFFMIRLSNINNVVLTAGLR